MAPWVCCIDRLYVGHLALLGVEPPVTIDVSNQLWHDEIGSRAEARDLTGKEPERRY